MLPLDQCDLQVVVERSQCRGRRADEILRNYYYYYYYYYGVARWPSG